MKEGMYTIKDQEQFVSHWTWTFRFQNLSKSAVSNDLSWKEWEKQEGSQAGRKDKKREREEERREEKKKKGTLILSFTSFHIE